ncbi:MAG: T9SS type A sorting domain-containing protein [Chitinophagaceae bacterium]
MTTLYKVAQNILLVVFITLATITAFCQPYELRAVNKGNGVIGIEMRVTGGTAPMASSSITDIQFGFKWAATYNVDLREALTTTYNIKKAGTRSLKNGFHFQAFYADPIGFNVPATWTVNTWVEILSIENTKTSMGTGLFSVAENGFDVSTNPNIGVDFIDYLPAINGNAPNVILPVTFLNYSVSPYTRFIQLKWTTGNEQDNKVFEIERSAGASDNFIKIGSVEAKLSSAKNNEYSFIDENVLSATKYFYRLKQIDLNGYGTFSDIKIAMLFRPDNETLRIIPNPVDKVLQILFNATSVKDWLVLKIVDVSGATVISKEVYIETGKREEVKVGNLVTGHYFLTLSKNNDVIYYKTFLKK